MKIARVYFDNEADFLAAKEKVQKSQKYVLFVDLDTVDRDDLLNGVVHSVHDEVIAMSEYEKRLLLNWLNEHDDPNYFLESLREGLKKYKRLTDKQMGALRKAFIQEEGKAALKSKPALKDVRERMEEITNRPPTQEQIDDLGMNFSEDDYTEEDIPF